MASRKDGIWVPKKVIIRMIVASVFINVVFLLMGMVIGREDGRWKARGDAQGAQVEPTEHAEISEDAIDMEMSLYDRTRSQERSKPIDVNYLDSEKADQKKSSPTRPSRTQKQTATPQEKTTSRPSSSGTYVIQVVATKNPNTIKEVTRKLTAAGYQVFTEKQGELRRICVGYFKTESSASVEKQKIDRSLKVNSWVRKQ